MGSTGQAAAEDAKDGGKVHRKTITISTVVSMLSICGVVLPVIGTLSFPWFVGFVSNAVAGEIQAEVRKQVQPITAALRAQFESQVAALEVEIARMEYRRDRRPDSWTEVDATDLVSKKRQLESQRTALVAMTAAERRPR